MLGVFRRSLKTGIVTTAYPAVPETAPSLFRGQVVLELACCSGDGACARVCPSQAIVVAPVEETGWVWELDDARCVFCGLCQEACPTGAIGLSNDFELTVRAADDLVTRVVFRPEPEGSEA